jgi:hypothetical protein
MNLPSYSTFNRTWTERFCLVVLAFGIACCATIPPPVTKSFADDRDSMLYEDLPYSVGASGIVITIPAGFVTDYASIPRGLWSFFPPHGQYSKAAIIHDYLYWTQECTKEQADNLLLIAMKESDVDGVSKWTIYYGVDVLGKSSWEEDTQMRAAGLIRVIPRDYWNFPNKVSWPEYRKELQKKNVHEKWPVQPRGYCELGNSGEVPTKNLASAQ